jgi:pyruvate dehydrogenase E1 component beta subunit
VIRIPYGGGINALEHHSESPEAYFGHTPGLKVVIPSTPYDAKGLLISAIEDPDPVIFMEPKRVYRAIKQEVPEEAYRIPLGKAKVLQQGEQITLIAYGAMIREAQKAIALLKPKGYSVELIDLRSIWPIDRETIAKSVQKTGRALVVTEAAQSYGPASELISVINEEAFLSLEAPPSRLTGFDTVIPLPLGEKHYIISPDRIAAEIDRLIRY